MRLSLELRARISFAKGPTAFSHSRRSKCHYLSVSEYSAHAVADNNIGEMIGIESVYFGQLLPQAEGGIENRCSSRIGEDPELVTFPYLRIRLQSVNRFYPGERSGHQTMNKDDRNSIRIVGLKEV